MPGPAPPGGLSGRRPFVFRAAGQLVEHQGYRLQRFLCELGGMGDDGRRVPPRRQERAHRNVGHQMMPDGVLHRVAQSVGRAGGRRLFRARQLGRDVEVAHGRMGAVRIDPERASRGQAPDMLEQRPRLRDASPDEEAGAPGGGRRSIDTAAGKEGLDLRREPQHAAGVRVVQRLDAEPVAGQEQTAPPCIPYREREHAPQPVDHRGAVAIVQVQQHLGIGSRPEAPPRRLQLSAEAAIVVDLAVERDHEPIAVKGHRLRAGRRGIDDGQPAMGQSDAPRRIQPVAPAVRTARRHVVPGPDQGARVHRGRVASPREVSGDSTHGVDRRQSYRLPLRQAGADGPGLPPRRPVTARPALRAPPQG